VSLALCDLQPKRGAENMFFVGIGISIIVLLFRGTYLASRGFYGLHFQYMTNCIIVVFSPGWNRITTALIRWGLQRWGGVDQQCFVINSWGQRGYLYVWSFLVGVAAQFFWWLIVFRAPFFKMWSVGFIVNFMLMTVLMACLWQTFYAGIVHGEPLNTHACTEMDREQWVNFTSALRTTGLFTASEGYGVCNAQLWNHPQGTWKISDFRVFRLMHPDGPYQDVGYKP